MTDIIATIDDEISEQEPIELVASCPVVLSWKRKSNCEFLQPKIEVFYKILRSNIHMDLWETLSDFIDQFNVKGIDTKPDAEVDEYRFT